MITKNVWNPIIVIHIILFNGFITSRGVMLQLCGKCLSQGKAPTENIKTNVKFGSAKIDLYMSSLFSEISRQLIKCILLDCCESPIIFLKEDTKAKCDVVIEDRICRKICTALTNMWDNTASMIRRSSILVTLNNPKFYRGMIDRFGRKWFRKFEDGFVRENDLVDEMAHHLRRIVSSRLLHLRAAIEKRERT